MGSRHERRPLAHSHCNGTRQTAFHSSETIPLCSTTTMTQTLQRGTLPVEVHRRITTDHLEREQHPLMCGVTEQRWIPMIAVSLNVYKPNTTARRKTPFSPGRCINSTPSARSLRKTFRTTLTCYSRGRLQVSAKRPVLGKNDLNIRRREYGQLRTSKSTG